MPLRVLLIASIIFFLRLSPVFAAIDVPNFGTIEVVVEGAKRTKPAYIDALVQKCIEKSGAKNWKDLKNEYLKQCVSNSRLFSSVEVELAEPEVRLNVKERWTLIPMPYFYSTDGRRSAGGFLFDSNFLGYGKTLGAGGSLSTDGNSFFLMYLDPSVKFSDYTLTLMASKRLSKMRSYGGDKINYGFDKEEAGGMVSPGYAITPSLKASVSVAYGDSSFTEFDRYAAPSDYGHASVGASISLSDSDYKLFYSDGYSINARWTGEVYRSEGADKPHKFTLRSEFAKAVTDRQVLQIGAKGEITTSDDVTGAITTGGRKGSRGIRPGSLWVKEIASFSADYQFALYKTGSGVFTVAPFVDYGVYGPMVTSKGGDYFAYGIGGYYYLNKVNFPGIGVAFGENDSFMGRFVTVQIGALADAGF